MTATQRLEQAEQIIAQAAELLDALAGYCPAWSCTADIRQAQERLALMIERWTGERT